MIEDTYITDTSDIEFTSRMYKELLQMNEKSQKTLQKKMGNDLSMLGFNVRNYTIGTFYGSEEESSGMESPSLT